MDEETLQNNFNTVFEGQKTTGNNQSVLSQQLKQLDDRVKQLELVIQTLTSTADIVMNLYNDNKGKIDEVLTTTLEAMKSNPEGIKVLETSQEK